MNFRFDINGMRALAVTAVVIYHFHPTWLPGGFAGVDVFFVISGFLMTGIIFNGLKNEDFNLFKFYIARANRIIPALATLCLFVLIFGWFFLPPLDYRLLGKHVASSIGFISNITYAKESGYFDSASQEKWLLHTWSLSVEWQFYILYPVILVLLKRFFNTGTLKKLVVITTIIGFIYSSIATIIWPTSSYYLLPTRAWEMLLGGVAFLYPWETSQERKKIAEITGIALIFSSYVLLSHSSSWPGFFALIPTLGTYLVIISNQQNSLITRNAISQKLGTWSYSIYLWHWPIVVLLGYLEVDYQWKVWGVFLSLILGYLSHKFIEKLQFSSYGNWRQAYKSKPILFMIIILLAGRIGYETEGFAFHYPEKIASASSEGNNKNPYNCMTSEDSTANLQPCYIGNSKQTKAVIIGDSHADALTTSVSSLFELTSSGIIAFTKASCPFVLNQKSVQNGLVCYEENLLRLKEVPKYSGIPIILVGRWSVYIYGQSDPKRMNANNSPDAYFFEKGKEDEQQLLNEFRHSIKETLCELTKTSPVIITQPVPEMRLNVPRVVSKNLILDTGEQVYITEEMYFERNSAIREAIAWAANSCGATIADPYKYLCQDGKCLGELDSRPLYYDGDHMSEFGNKILTPMFQEALRVNP